MASCVESWKEEDLKSAVEMIAEVAAGWDISKAGERVRGAKDEAGSAANTTTTRFAPSLKPFTFSSQAGGG